MAEVIFNSRLGELPEGWVGESAGICACNGCKASSGSIFVAHEMGLDLSRHRSQPASREKINASRLVIAMTESHAEFLREIAPEATDRIHLLKEFDPRGGKDIDVPDPFGLYGVDYRFCRDDIDASMSGLIAFIKKLVAEEQSAEGAGDL